MTIRKIGAFIGLCVLSVSAHAQGSFSFDRIGGLGSEPMISIDFNSIAIGFVRTLLAEVDPATAELLVGLRGIALRVYHSDGNNRQINSFIEDVTGELQDKGWQQIMSVQDESVSVSMHMQMTEEDVAGLTLMLFDGQEAVFLNIDGSVSAADLGKVMAAINQSGVLNGLPQFGAQ